MRRFVELYTLLEDQPAPAAQRAAVARYLSTAPTNDQAWALYLLGGGKLRQQVSPRLMRQAACQAAGLPPWLLEQAYQTVGDLAETIAHVLPPPRQHATLSLAEWLQTRLLMLGPLAPEAKTQALQVWWDELHPAPCFVVNKLLSGHWRSPLHPDGAAHALEAPEHPRVPLPVQWANHPGLSVAVPTQPHWQHPPHALQTTAVLLYGHSSPGANRGTCNAYTLAVWNRAPHDEAEALSVQTAIATRQAPDPLGLQLVPLARVDNQLPPDEARTVDDFMQNHLLERFGPVRSVLPQLVFELAFDALAPSKRHKSGLILQAPRLLQRLHHTQIHQVDTLERLRALLDHAALP